MASVVQTGYTTPTNTTKPSRGCCVTYIYTVERLYKDTCPAIFSVLLTVVLISEANGVLFNVKVSFL